MRSGSVSSDSLSSSSSWRQKRTDWVGDVLRLVEVEGENQSSWTAQLNKRRAVGAGRSLGGMMRKKGGCFFLEKWWRFLEDCQTFQGVSQCSSIITSLSWKQILYLWFSALIWNHTHKCLLLISAASYNYYVTHQIHLPLRFKLIYFVIIFLPFDYL